MVVQSEIGLYPMKREVFCFLTKYSLWNVFGTDRCDCKTLPGVTLVFGGRGSVVIVVMVTTSACSDWTNMSKTEKLIMGIHTVHTVHTVHSEYYIL